MGEKVQIGPLAYTVLESEWKNSLGENATSPAPRNRYLILRLSCENTGKASAVMPTMELESPAKQTYTEVTQGLQELPNWLGVLRTVQPGQTAAGRVVFDAPIGGYKLMIPDTADTGSEKYALVDIPVQLQ